MKKNSNAIIIAACAVAVCVVAVVCALLIKSNFSKTNEEKKESARKDAYHSLAESTTHNYGQYNEYTTGSNGVTLPDETPSQGATQNYENPTQAPTTGSSNNQEEITVPQLDEDNMSSGQANTGSISTPSSGLPNDMSLAGLYRQGYNVIGLKQYIFNDDQDPNCMQANFGYNYLYDIGANLIDFSIETTKLDFDYGDKSYRIQLWKGQYISGDVGTVGGEVGVYTRPRGSSAAFDHYDCAAHEDWLYMEMTCFWDENGDGNYLPQFTRNYDLHWWQTGFVDGQLANRRDSTPLRILSHITFKDEEMAKAFEQALISKGFRGVDTFRPTEIDTYKRSDKDVIFLWQDVR